MQRSLDTTRAENGNNQHDEAVAAVCTQCVIHALQTSLSLGWSRYYRH